MIFRAGSPSEWDEILDVSHAAFATREPRYFPRHYPHTYPGPEAARWFCVCECDGRIVGVINQTPMTMKIGRGRLRAIGIGGVCCLPAYRRRGVMSGMLNWVDARQRAASTKMAILWGERVRYRRYGYEVAGAEPTVRLFAGHLAEVEPVPLRRLRQVDADAVVRLSRRTGSAVYRSLDWQRLLLRRKGFRAYGNRDGALRAYLVVHESADQACEVAGPRPIVMGLMKAWMRRGRIDRISFPVAPGEATGAYAMAHAFVGATHVCGLVGIYDFAGFLEAAAASLARNFEAFGMPRRLRVRRSDDGVTCDLVREGRELSVLPVRARRAPDISLDRAAWIRTLFPTAGANPEKGVSPRAAAALRLPLQVSGWDSL